MMLRRSCSSPNLGGKEPLIVQEETNSNPTMGFWFIERVTEISETEMSDQSDRRMNVLLNLDISLSVSV